jgi:hypothetical protein
MDHFSVSEVEGEYEGVSKWRVWKGERRRKGEREKRGEGREKEGMGEGDVTGKKKRQT